MAGVRGWVKEHLSALREKTLEKKQGEEYIRSEKGKRHLQTD